MAVNIHEYAIYMSGGASNDTPDLSLGGSRSTLSTGRVASQVATAPTNVTGVVIDRAYNNPIGIGTLKWDYALATLQWKPFGALSFISTPITVDGVYVLGNVSGYLECTVDVSSLPLSTQQDADIVITNALNNTYDSVSIAESTSGSIEYRCFYLRNLSATDTVYNATIWILQQPVGPDELDIALDPAGIGNGTSTGVAIGPIADEADSGGLLSGLTWSRPSSQATGLLMGNLAPGQSHAYWTRRTVPAENTIQVSNDTSIIGYSGLL